MSKHPKLLYLLFTINTFLYVPLFVRYYNQKGIFYGLACASIVSYVCWTTFDWVLRRIKK